MNLKILGVEIVTSAQTKKIGKSATGWKIIYKLREEIVKLQCEELLCST
ncbi:MAG: hypothetical protein HUJ51_04930 [Eggerthellaceae bacterium]|nr:hypothetical protein [Eggerthellaceae bacterium]